MTATIASYLSGTTIELTTTLDVDGVPQDAVGPVTLEITDPPGTITFATVTPLGSGVYQGNVLGDVPGQWKFRWLALGQAADEGVFEVLSIFVGGVTDQRDLRTLIPACRRAIDGPMTTSPAAPSATLDDPQVLALIADATAMLILQTQGNEAFGYQLIPTARDPFYQAPIAWMTDKQRVPAADAAILSQAALDHYFWTIKLLKVSETMKNEAVEWEYNLSANVIASWMKYLIDNRDKAIAALQVINAPMDVYISLVAERDRLSAAWLEPWVSEVGAVVPYAGGGGSGPLDFDFRFGTYG